MPPLSHAMADRNVCPTGSNILDKSRRAGLVQREIVIGRIVPVRAWFLDEVDRGEDDDQGGDDQPEDVVGGDATGAAAFEIDEECAGECGKNRPEFSQIRFHKGLLNRRGEGAAKGSGRLSADYRDECALRRVCPRDAGVKVCAA